MLGIFELVIFFCLLGYFLSKNRSTIIIDIVTTRFNEAYIYLTDNNANNLKAENTYEDISKIKRFNQESSLLKGKLIRTKSLDEKDVGRYTQTTVDTLTCNDCAKTNNVKLHMDPYSNQREAVDILQVTPHAEQSVSGKFDWGSYFPHLVQNLRVTKFQYPRIYRSVLEDKRMVYELQRAAKESVREKEINTNEEEHQDDKYFEEMLKKHVKRAELVLTDMASKISDNVLRLTSYVLYKLLPCFLSGVVAHPDQIEMLKVAQSKMPDVPLIFLPLHRSHLDYILVTFILLNHDIKSPLVAAGNNLRIPVFGHLLRRLGAFYIKRKIDPIAGKKDRIYRSLLQIYLQEALKAGHNVEFFIEGGRTRTGKPCIPKAGILSVIIDAFMDGLIKDAILVPVSINYEKLADGNFVNEQLGQKKEAETFKQAISSIWKIVNSRFGLMRIDFNEPFSLKELVKSLNTTVEQAKENPSTRKLMTGPSTSSLYGTDVVCDEHRVLVDSIARHVVFDCSKATSIMSTNALAYLLLHQFREGTTLTNLAAALTRMRKNVGTDRDFGFTGESVNVVKHAVDILGSGLVTMQAQGHQMFVKPVLMLPNVIELSYYSNTFVPYFALDAVVVTIAQKFASLDAVGQSCLCLEELVQLAVEYCDLLRYEFILHKPCQDLEELLRSAVRRLARQGVFEIKSKPDSCSTILVCLKPESCDKSVLLSTLSPIIHTYTSVVQCLCKLIGTPSSNEAEFIKMCLKNIKDKVDSGACKYGEAISVDTIKNCIKLLEKWTVVVVDSRTGARMIELGENFDSLYNVRDVVDRIEKFFVP